jgi:hypothetical protein
MSFDMRATHLLIPNTFKYGTVSSASGSIEWSCQKATAQTS